MTTLTSAMMPEILLAVVACLLFLLGTSSRAFARRIAAELALIAVTVVFVMQAFHTRENAPVVSLVDSGGAVHIQALGQYVKLITAGMGILLVLLNWPTNRDATGSAALDTGSDTAEFFGLLLLSLAGLCVIASANDLTLLFLGIELASIPTYIMVTMSRPLPVAQEAGLKYFFLGAMSAAVMLFGFSYLYGTTGTTNLSTIAEGFSRTDNHTPWQVLAIAVLIAGFAFKIAAVPLHAYAGDVYQGAATPVTALLSFVPKTAGFIALLKVLYAVGGENWNLPPSICKLLWVLAALTMTTGNVLALLQYNVKRMLAYSSVAHTGYMLVGVTALVHTPDEAGQSAALQGVLFYLAAYGLMNIAAFGVLQLLPSRHNRPATTAETFEDLAGQGRKHVGLGLAMAIACFSLTGIPPAVGFVGKMYLAVPAGHAGLTWLSVILWTNSAISAVYYLRIVGTMFLRPEPTHLTPLATPVRLVQPATIVIAVMASSVLTILLGGFPPVTHLLSDRVDRAAVIVAPEAPAEVAMNRP